MKSVLKFESPRIHITGYFEASVKDMLSAARAQGLEGVVAKRKDRRGRIADTRLASAAGPGPSIV